MVVDTGDKWLAMSEPLGATHAVNIRRDGGRQHLGRILGEAGADVVIECAGTRSALELVLDIVGWRGRIDLEWVLGTDEMVPISPYRLVSRPATLIGVNGWVTADSAQALDFIWSGLVDAKQLVTHTFSLEA